jgi:hypothetical protein
MSNLVKKRTMKKVIVILSTTLLLASCVTSTKIATVSGVENLKREDYTVLDEQKTVSRSNKFWFLFIPIGSKSNEKREAQSLKKMLKRNKADGVLAAKYVHRKFTVPLIVFTYTYKQTTLTGKPFVLKVDSVKTK